MNFSKITFLSKLFLRRILNIQRDVFIREKYPWLYVNFNE